MVTSEEGLEAEADDMRGKDVDIDQAISERTFDRASQAQAAQASPPPLDPPAPVRRVYDIPLDSNETGESSVAFQLTRHKHGIEQTFPQADPVDYEGPRTLIPAGEAPGVVTYFGHRSHAAGGRRVANFNRESRLLPQPAASLSV